MENPPKFKRTQGPEYEEAKKITNAVVKKIFKEYTLLPHIPASELEAYENVDDICAIHDIIHTMILRRNASWFKRP
jgi:hypothetical protein